MSPAKNPSEAGLTGLAGVCRGGRASGPGRCSPGRPWDSLSTWSHFAEGEAKVQSGRVTPKLGSWDRSSPSAHPDLSTPRVDLGPTLCWGILLCRVGAGSAHSLAQGLERRTGSHGPSACRLHPQRAGPTSRGACHFPCTQELYGFQLRELHY